MSLVESGRRTYFNERNCRKRKGEQVTDNLETGNRGRHTKKKAFARKVYVNVVQPTQPPVPLPGDKTSDVTSVTMMPTNLYPEYATRSSNCESLLMLRMYMASLRHTISNTMTAIAVVVIDPSNSG